MVLFAFLCRCRSDCSVDDDEILYACIQSAMPKAKPAPPPRSSSSASTSNGSTSGGGAALSAAGAAKYPSAPDGAGPVRGRPSQPPLELPKSAQHSVKEVGFSFYSPLSFICRLVSVDMFSIVQCRHVVSEVHSI